MTRRRKKHGSVAGLFVAFARTGRDGDRVLIVPIFFKDEYDGAP